MCTLRASLRPCIREGVLCRPLGIQGLQSPQRMSAAPLQDTDVPQRLKTWGVITKTRPPLNLLSDTMYKLVPRKERVHNSAPTQIINISMWHSPRKMKTKNTGEKTTSSSLPLLSMKSKLSSGCNERKSNSGMPSTSSAWSLIVFRNWTAIWVTWW